MEKALSFRTMVLALLTVLFLGTGQTAAGQEENLQPVSIEEEILWR